MDKHAGGGQALRNLEDECKSAGSIIQQTSLLWQASCTCPQVDSIRM
jgi:hypothetical protein